MNPSRPPRTWPDRRAVWRWHFYAGLLCLPVVCWLAVTGSIYLWRPQIEAVLDRPYDRLAPGAVAAPPRLQVAAAVESRPGSTFNAYEPPRTPTASARVMLAEGRDLHRVYVDPYTLEVLKSVKEDDRPMRVVSRLHGELLLGDRGSYVVELAASWAIVMILTGLLLWWPRRAASLGGLLYPRLRLGARLFWRDMHAVTGVWVSAFALFLLVSGLPWSSSWGLYLKAVREVTGSAAVRQDWSVGRSAELAARAAAAAQDEHAGHGGHVHGAAAASAPYGDLDRVAAAAAAADLPPPVVITPPAAPGVPWTAKSDTADRPRRVVVRLDALTGAVVDREDFGERHWIDQAVGYGIAAHEGQLFGLANQLLGLFTAAGLVTLSVSAVVLWLRRRPQGVLGAPEPLSRPRFALGLAGVILLLGVLLPLFGASLLLVAFLDRFVLRRFASVSRWLGLSFPAARGPGSAAVA